MINHYQALWYSRSHFANRAMPSSIVVAGLNPISRVRSYIGIGRRHVSRLHRQHFLDRVATATLKHVSKNDLVLWVTTPFSLPFPVMLATKLRNASAILLIYDLYAEALIVAGFGHLALLVISVFLLPTAFSEHLMPL